MDSFYGGRPGYGFVLRGPASGGSFTSSGAIQNAVTNGELFFGDYAIVGGSDSQATGFGNIYRVNEKKGLDLIGNISAPVFALTPTITENLTANQKSMAGDTSLNQLTVYSQQDGSTLKIGFKTPVTKITTSKELGASYDLTSVDGTAATPFSPQLKLTYPPIVSVAENSSSAAAEGEILLIWEERTI